MLLRIWWTVEIDGFVLHHVSYIAECAFLLRSHPAVGAAQGISGTILIGACKSFAPLVHALVAGPCRIRLLLLIKLQVHLCIHISPSCCAASQTKHKYMRHGCATLGTLVLWKSHSAVLTNDMSTVGNVGSSGGLPEADGTLPSSMRDNFHRQDVIIDDSVVVVIGHLDRNEKKWKRNILL